MSNVIKIFENEEFGRVRTIIKDSEPWFVGKDVAEILEYRNTKKALSDHVDEEDKYQGNGVTIRDPMGRMQHPTIINESGLYSLILSSKMPRAKEFKRWVTSEILPTIRRTGGYVANEDMFVDNYLPFLDDAYRNLFRLQMIAINQLNERIRHDKPLVEFANQVANTNNLIDMNAMAKLAREENIPVGRNKLFDRLKRMGVLMSNNLPYQQYIDRGYFAVKESVFKMDGLKKTYQQTLVTGKGQVFIIGLLKKYYGSYMSNQLLGKGNTVAAIDELYLFLTNMTAIEYIRNGMKRVRKKESSFILASQNIEDFLLPEIKEFTKPLFSIPTHHFLFNPGSISPTAFIDTLQLEESEYSLIKYPERGTCLYRCGNERYLLQVIAPAYKAALFGSAGGR